MAEKSGFFNGKLQTDEYGYPLMHEDGSQMYDREYTASEFADMFNIYLTDGIRNGGTNLKVMANTGLSLRILPGDAMIKGYFYRLIGTDKILFLEENINPEARIDAVILRLDLREDEGRKISLVIKKSFEELVQTDEIWELCLAKIHIGIGSTIITDAEITDTRLNSDYCGLINSMVEVDTSLLFNQIDAYFEQKKLQWNSTSSDYENWYNGIMNSWQGWFNQIKVELFSQVNTIFDDWSRQSGYNKEIKFVDNDAGECYRIEETLYNRLNQTVQATRTTEFPGKDIKETLEYSNPLLKVYKVTRFDEGKIVEEVH